MATHTPGPWNLWTGQTGAFEVYVGEPLRGDVIVQRHDWNHKAEESKANAHLIAAAPDLLAALKAMRHPDYGTPEDPSELTHQARSIADAAIAKAEGRS